MSLPYNTFDRLADECESRGLRSALYFIARKTPFGPDAKYGIDDPWIRDLIRRLHARGHEIGLHASFESCSDRMRARHEITALKAMCEQIGVRQSVWGSRQHFLRWKTPQTYATLEFAGLDYDSSMTFAENAGFRCGTCHGFEPFDLIERRVINLVERPLVVMDTTVIDYMGLGTGDAAIEKISTLKQRCRSVKGCFTLLWHNSNLNSADHWRLLLSALDC